MTCTCPWPAGHQQRWLQAHPILLHHTKAARSRNNQIEMGRCTACQKCYCSGLEAGTCIISCLLAATGGSSSGSGCPRGAAHSPRYGLLMSRPCCAQNASMSIHSAWSSITSTARSHAAYQALQHKQALGRQLACQTQGCKGGAATPGSFNWAASGVITSTKHGCILL